MTSRVLNTLRRNANISACECLSTTVSAASFKSHAPSREGNGTERCRFIDIFISRPCGDGNTVHSLNCMD